MPDFSRRTSAPEMMDDFALGRDTIDPIMDELEVINKVLGGHSVFTDAFKDLNIKNGMVVSDWGCGGGDSLRVLAEWSRRKNLEIRWVGVDATAAAVEYAKLKAAKFGEISFIHSDVFSPRLKSGQFDIVISSLFTHHFADRSWIKLIVKMLECSTYAVIVNDLHRHWFAYHSIGLLTKVFSRSPMVKHDSKVSVLRGFKKKELEHMLGQAGIVNYRLKWKWAFRWQLIILKSEHARV